MKTKKKLYWGEVDSGLQIKDKDIKKIRVVHENRDGEPHKSKNKMYIYPNETLLGNFENRRNRPHTIWKKEIIPLVMDWLKTNEPKHYKELKDSKWGWRQNCGCSMCPCSPGFVSNNEGYITILVDL